MYSFQTFLRKESENLNLKRMLIPVCARPLIMSFKTVFDAVIRQFPLSVKQDFYINCFLSQVKWEITDVTGSSGSRGLQSTSGRVTFDPGEFLKNILVEIKADDVPELEAVYMLRIVSVDGGADLDLSSTNVTFKVR